VITFDVWHYLMSLSVWEAFMALAPLSNQVLVATNAAMMSVFVNLDHWLCTTGCFHFPA